MDFCIELSEGLWLLGQERNTSETIRFLCTVAQVVNANDLKKCY